MRLFLFLLIIACFDCHAQSTLERTVINTAGADFNGSGLSVSYSIGEAVTGAVICPEVKLIQGFIQPPDKIKVSVESECQPLKITIFPNPVNEILIIEIQDFDGYDNNLIEASISGLDGRILQVTKLHKGLNTLDCSSLAAGLYFLSIGNGIISETLKIAKM